MSSVIDAFNIIFASNMHYLMDKYLLLLSFPAEVQLQVKEMIVSAGLIYNLYCLNDSLMDLIKQKLSRNGLVWMDVRKEVEDKLLECVELIDDSLVACFLNKRAMNEELLLKLN